MAYDLGRLQAIERGEAGISDRDAVVELVAGIIQMVVRGHPRPSPRLEERYGNQLHTLQEVLRRLAVDAKLPTTLRRWVASQPDNVPKLTIRQVAERQFEALLARLDGIDDDDFATPAVAADAAAVLEVVGALESSLYGKSAFSQADLEEEWSGIDLERDTRVIRDGERIVGYGMVRRRGELWRVEGYVHPDAHGRGIGKLIATGLEEDAARGGGGRIQNAVLEADSAARRLLESLGYAAVRVFRELRIELDAPPPAPDWPDGLRVVPFDPERDALEFHAAHEEAFADTWDYTPRDFESWANYTLGSERFDPTLWCVVRTGDEIVAGTICAGDTYGGGWIHALFTRRPWRRQGVGAALLRDSFGRFWERGEHSVALSVDAASDTGAFRLYERAGMAPMLGWVAYEKELVSPP